MSYTSADILRAAAVYLERHGWCRGNVEGEGTVPRGALGAIHRVWKTSQADEQVFMGAVNALTAHLGPALGYSYASYMTVLTAWNDSPRKGVKNGDEVIQVLHRVADQLDPPDHT